MQSFFGFVRKEFYHIARDRRTLLILFGMPLIQLLLFGYAIRNEVQDVRLAIVDLVATGYFSATLSLDEAAQIDDAFERGAVREVLVFEPNFAQQLAQEGRAAVQIITDGTDPNTARIMRSYTTAVLQDVQRDLSGGAPGGVRIEPVVRMRFNPTLESVNLFVPGLIAVILMLVSTLMTSITITREKETGTMEVLLVSPLRPVQIIIGKVIPYFALAFANVITILAVAWWVFEVPIRGSLLLLLAESMLFAVAALALGVFISTRVATQQAAMMIALAGLLLPTIILSGFIFPIESMPWPLQWLSHIVPAKWFLVIVKGIMLKGIGLTVLWKETLVLTGMTVLFVGASIKNLNIRLE
jgi:ABC-2 type transport system permease protein